MYSTCMITITYIVHRSSTIPIQNTSCMVPFLYHSHAKYKLYNMHSTLHIPPIPVPFLYHSCTIPKQNISGSLHIKYHSHTKYLLYSTIPVPSLYHSHAKYRFTVCTVPFPFQYHYCTIPMLNTSSK